MSRARALAFVVVVTTACGGGGHARDRDRPWTPPATGRSVRDVVDHAPVPRPVGQLVTDDAAFARFAATVRDHLRLGLTLVDSATAELRDRRFVLAMLDALDGRWDAAIVELDRVAATIADPRERAMQGLTIRIWADARAHEGDSPAGFRAALERALEHLPVADYAGPLAMLRAMGVTFTPATCARLVDESVTPDAAGEVGLDGISAIVFQRYAAVRLAPVGAILDQVLATHGVALPQD